MNRAHAEFYDENFDDSQYEFQAAYATRQEKEYEQERIVRYRPGSRRRKAMHCSASCAGSSRCEWTTRCAGARWRLRSRDWRRSGPSSRRATDDAERSAP